MIYSHSIYFVTNPIDMRSGMDRLTTFLQVNFPKKCYSGALFIFTNRQRSMFKLISIDPHGMWLCQRKLHQGHFPKFQTGQSELILTQAQFNWLCKGFDFSKIDGLNLASYQH
ncbi:IS66 family insertion sequence element accessory protein TnpB [Thorsellia anophelis]|uniref:Transposase n=1 Tax=Thorsellia anophelis DSM 18579 TaxID=1123402 RepID=A0A1I0F275_9GAMM|nr:IS66 family insertion sequence element accessory protein TnpB [Thorsellia anophelis]SET51907.1 transposase [Thorsellia anophelis DSM 18579]